jgi:hypothetical protein
MSGIAAIACLVAAALSPPACAAPAPAAPAPAAPQIRWSVVDRWHGGSWSVADVRFPPGPGVDGLGGALAVIDVLQTPGHGQVGRGRRGSYRAPLIREPGSQPDTSGTLRARIGFFPTANYHGDRARLRIEKDGVTIASWTAETVPWRNRNDRSALLVTGQAVQTGRSLQLDALRTIGARDVPGTVLALDPFAIVIWDETSWSSLQESQVAAIDGWVATGGILVLTAPALASGPPHRWRPALVATSAQRYRVDPRTVGLILTGDGTAVDEAEALALDAPRGRWITAAAGRPLAVVRPHGAGRIVGLGIDPGWARRDGRPIRTAGETWSLLAHGRRSSRGPPVPRAPADLACLAPDGALAMPEHVRTIWGWLGLLGALLAGLHASARRLTHRIEAAAAVVVVGSLTSLVLLRVMAPGGRHGAGTMRGVQMLSVAPDSPVVVATHHVGGVSSYGRSMRFRALQPDLEVHQVHTGSGRSRDSSLSSILGLSEEPEPIFDVDASTGSIRSVQVATRAGRMAGVRATGQLRTPGSVAFTGTLDGAAVRFSVANALPFPLIGATIIAGGRAIDVVTPPRAGPPQRRGRPISARTAPRVRSVPARRGGRGRSRARSGGRAATNSSPPPPSRRRSSSTSRTTTPVRSWWPASPAYHA